MEVEARLAVILGLLAAATSSMTACPRSQPVDDTDADGAHADGDIDADSDIDGDSDIDADCGDGACAGTETARSCPDDCPAECGDSACTHDETADSCPTDCSADDCDLLALTGGGCTTGEKCGVYSPDGHSIDVGCVPLDEIDAVGPGEVCTMLLDARFGTFDNCRQGYTCRYSREGSCERFCSEGESSACEDAYPDPGSGAMTGDGVCLYSLEDLRDVAPGVMLCGRLESCDPFCQGCAGADENCLPQRDGSSYCVDISRPTALPGDGITGDACDRLNGCLAGYICTDGICAPMCDPSHVHGAGEPTCPFVSCTQHSDEGVGDCIASSVFPGVGACAVE